MDETTINVKKIDNDKLCVKSHLLSILEAEQEQRYVKVLELKKQAKVYTLDTLLELRRQ